MTGIAQNGNKRLIFIVVPQVRTNMREKSRRGQKQKYMRRDKSKENTLIYIHMYICTHPRTYKHIYTQIHICTYTHYLLFKQIALFDIMFECI